MRRIGLIGGVGWVATRDYYTRLNRGVALRLGGLHGADLVIRSLDLQRLLDRLGTPGAVDETIAQAGDDLVRAGAELVAIASVTGHRFAGTLARRACVPLVDALDATGAALARSGVVRVGAFATRASHADGWLAARLADHGVELVPTDAAHRDSIDRAIFEELEHERIGPLALGSLDAGEHALRSAGVGDLVLGCTELSFAYATRDTRLRVWDVVALHCDALLDAAFDARPPQ